MLQTILTKVFGTKSDREIKSLDPMVEEINRIAESLESKSQEDIVRRTEELREQIVSARNKLESELEESGLDKDEINKRLVKAEEDILEEILPEAFAIVKDTCRRLVGESWKITGQEITWDMIPYDVLD